ncbi:threonylcarbamoyl-AMP synthase [Candidatus Woesearchaeota archaeon]|nr:threonylcarbamoyl-AMP synthase [Candidatus Woesearchaeota archaeon]
MNVITRDELMQDRYSFMKMVDDGAIFIHPTDTIYGIGCNACDNNAVLKIRSAKNRHDMPFSVIAPSKEWIKNNCKISKYAEKWVDKLPGPYTLILNLKNNFCIASEVNKNSGTIGVRIPDHWISTAVSELGKPIVTTSANVTGRTYMTRIEDLHNDVKKCTDFAIYEGEKIGRPSTIIDLTGKEKIVKR